MNAVAVEQHSAHQQLHQFGVKSRQTWSCGNGCHWLIYGVSASGSLCLAVNAALRVPADQVCEQRLGVPVFATYIGSADELGGFLHRCAALGVAEDDLLELYARLYRITPGAVIFEA